ncbi:hypothetical protein EMCRGX_G022182 [Ephydatia muelleri]
MVVAKKYVLKSHFQGLPKREDLEIVEEELPPLKDGEILTETLWLSVDPYMRPYSQRMKLGDTMIGELVAKVTESKNPGYAVGDVIVANVGWRTHTILGESFFQQSMPKIRKVDPSINLPSSTAVGILGMPGATSYYGFLNICSPKSGETLVVTGAAGAVGSAVGQIAKIKGCRVVGFAGSDDKVAYLKSIGFDEAINYKTVTSLSDAVKKACPNGVDMFFDNVGGEFFEVVLSQMNTFGRVSVCGCISQYNLEEPPKARPVSSLILFHQLKVEGFLVWRWNIEEWAASFKEIAQWIQEGKLKYEETVTEGFDKMFDAFLGLFKGENLGKAVVKV